MLGWEKWKSTNHILQLNRMIDEFKSSLAQKRGEMTYMNQESVRYDKTGNSRNPKPVHILLNYLIAIIGRGYKLSR